MPRILPPGSISGPCALFLDLRTQEAFMDQFEYSCADHGVVTTISRDEIPEAHPPSECPDCGGDLRVDVRH